MSDHDYRLYSFVNTYLTGIHAGIQTAHVIAEMSQKYQNQPYDKFHERMADWQEHDKTIVVLNGGTNDHLLTVLEQVMAVSRQYSLPYASFYESKEALGGIMTAVGVVLPSYLYDSRSSRAADCPVSRAVWDSRLAS